MKDFILRSKSLMLILFIGVLFSCSKEKPKTLLSEPTKVDANSTISERQECCGSIIFSRTGGKPFTVDFKVWYLDNTGHWVSTNCTSPIGQSSYTFNFCHNSNSPFLYLLEPCGSISALDWANYQIAVTTINSCGMIKVWGNCCCKAINYGPVILSVPFNGSNYFNGWAGEVNLCCN